MTTQLYTGPITITQTTTLKYRAVSPEGIVGDVQSVEYTILSKLISNTQIQSAELVGILTANAVTENSSLSVSVLQGRLNSNQLDTVTAITSANLTGSLTAQSMQAVSGLTQGNLSSINAVTTNDAIAFTSISSAQLIIIPTVYADNLQAVSTVQISTLVGMLTVDVLTANSSIQYGDLYEIEPVVSGDLIASSMCNQANLFAILTGSGSIRSPSGEEVQYFRADGTSIVIKRYVNGFWQ